MRSIPFILVAAALLASSVSAAELSAVVHKPTADVYAQPRFDAPKVATLQRNTAVKISAQQGLWYQLLMPAGAPGFVRVNDVRVAYAGAEDGEANLRVLMGGKAGKGRVTETAGVRGIDESDLKSAALNQAQLNAMVGHRVDASAAAAYAAEQGWQATSVAYAGEAKAAKKSGKPPAEPAASKRSWRNPWAACSVHSASTSARSWTRPPRWRRSPRTSWRRRSSRSARKSPAAFSARARCGTMTRRSSASTSSDAGSPRRRVVRSCPGPSA